MGRMRTMVMAGVLTASLVGGAARPAGAAADYVNDFGMGLGTVLANCFYMPTKVVYATLGGLTGSFAYVLTGGRMDTASAVWVPSLGGTYVLTPDMLRGEDPVYFSGVAESREASRDGYKASRDDYGKSLDADGSPRDNGMPREGY